MNRLLMAQGPMDRLSMLLHGVGNLLWVLLVLVLGLVAFVLVAVGGMGAWEWMTNHPRAMLVVTVIGILVALVGWIWLGGALPVIAGLLLAALGGFAVAGSL